MLCYILMRDFQKLRTRSRSEIGRTRTCVPETLEYALCDSALGFCMSSSDVIPKGYEH